MYNKYQPQPRQRVREQSTSVDEVISNRILAKLHKTTMGLYGSVSEVTVNLVESHIQSWPVHCLCQRLCTCTAQLRSHHTAGEAQQSVLIADLQP